MKSLLGYTDMKMCLLMWMLTIRTCILFPGQKSLAVLMLRIQAGDTEGEAPARYNIICEECVRNAVILYRLYVAIA